MLLTSGYILPIKQKKYNKWKKIFFHCLKDERTIYCTYQTVLSASTIGKSYFH